MKKLLILILFISVSVTVHAQNRRKVQGDTLIIRNGGSFGGTVGVGIRDAAQKLHIQDETAGILRARLENTSSASAAVVGSIYEVVNDLGYWGAIGITNSGSTILSSSLANTYQNYNQGYGDFLFTNDGDTDFRWFTDPTDSHDFSALGNEVMRLTSAGFLGLATDSPIYRLDVAGQTQTDTLRLNNTGVYADSILTAITDSDSALVTAGAVIDYVDNRIETIIYSRGVGLNASQVSTLGTVPVTIVSAPSAGQYINPIVISVKITPSVPLAIPTGEFLVFGWNSGVGCWSLPESAIETSTEKRYYIPSEDGAAYSSAITAAAALTMKLDNGVDPTAGSATMEVTVLYTIETF